MKIINNTISETKVFKLGKITPSVMADVLERLRFQTGVDFATNEQSRTLTVKVWWGLGENYDENRKREATAFVKDTMAEIEQIVSINDV